MCICVNCNHVHICNTYALIKRQHGKFDFNTMLEFIPNQTIIQITIKNYSHDINFDWDLRECLSFSEKPGEWLNKEKEN